MSSAIDQAQQEPTAATQYVELLLARQREEALRLVRGLVEDHVDVRDIYLDVLEPAQHRVGALWESNQISVAQEHYCTASTQQAIAELYPHVFATESDGRRVVVACVGGELHELGARMVADFLQMDGWDTTYLSANVPAEDIADELAATDAHMLCCSVALDENIPAVKQVIGEIRATRPEVPILVGGLPFSRDPDLARQVGADGTAADAQGAVTAANQLVPKP